MRHKALVLLGSVVVGLALAGRASADMIGNVTLTAETATGSVATQTWSTDGVTEEVLGDGSCRWKLYDNEANPLCLKDGGDTVVAQVKQVWLESANDPSVGLFFSVEAGADPTTFTFTSPTITFPAVSNPLARATVGVTLTERDGNGAVLTGVFSGAKAYEARYNDLPMVTWAGLVNPVEVAAGDGTAVASDRKPGSGDQVIPATVNQIMSEFHFTLSAHDQASGTSDFRVTPEPSTFVLLGAGILGMLAYAWRRKSAK